MNCKEDVDKGSAMTRFIERGTRSNLPNSLDRSVDSRQHIEMRGKEREKIVRKKERIEGKKETYKVGERVKLQDFKSKMRNTEGVVIGVRTANDGTFVSCEIDKEGCVTTRHRK